MRRKRGAGGESDFSLAVLLAAADPFLRRRGYLTVHSGRAGADIGGVGGAGSKEEKSTHLDYSFM